MAKTKKITVQSTEISVRLNGREDDYISLTDMARYKDNDPFAVIGHWMRSRNTLEYLGAWEILHNPNFKPTEFDRFMNEAGFNSFTMSPKKWIDNTNAIGIQSKAGRYGGTYAHKDIAFNFGMWLSPVFQLYIVKEYQRLKEAENNPLVEQWDIKRLLSKTNYTLHTDAIKSVIPKLKLSKFRERMFYADEADMLNIILFGCTAEDWREANPELARKGLNVRDTATINQLIVLSNIEAMNSELIKQRVERKKRMMFLHRVAKEQLSVLDKNNIEQKFRKLSSSDEVKRLG